MRGRIRYLAWLGGATAATLLVGASCTASSVPGADRVPEIDAGPNDAAPDRADVEVPLPDSGMDSGADGGPSPLCGVGACFPDDTVACTPAPPGLDAGSEPDPDAGDEDASDEETGDAGDEDAGDAADEDAGDASDEGGSDGEPEPSQEAAAPIYGCRIVASGRVVTRECALAGEGRFDAPCLSSANCAPGFACVGEGEGGLCRPFCCAGNSACGEGLFCTELPLVDPYTAADTPTLVPVCAIPEQCNLSQPYPCPAELAASSQCTCKDGKACMLVTANGTSCVEPGTGLSGDDCPCAWGHVCSQGTGKCLKLCSTSNLEPQCGGGRCTTFNGVPSGWGVCAGLYSDGG